MRAKTIKELPVITAQHFISLGHRCTPAYWLSRFSLRLCSLPFDWMMAYPLDLVYKSLKYGCAYWFEDFSIINDDGIIHHSVVDNKTGMISLHNFPKDKDVTEFLPLFHKQYDKRMLRFQKICAKSRKICFVFNRSDDMNVILKFANDMHSLYPRLKMVFLWIVHSESESNILQMRVHRWLHIYKIIGNNTHHDITSPHEWIGNIDLWDSVMSRCRRIEYVKKYKFFMREKIISDANYCPVEWRLDVKNFGVAKNDIVIDAPDACVEFPSWFTNGTGRGAVLSAKTHGAEIKITAVRDGVLRLIFRGPDRRANDVRFPFWVDYSSIMIDGRQVLSKPISTWHDCFWEHNIPVKDGSTVTVKFTQCPHSYTDSELAELLANINVNNKMTQTEVKRIYAYLKGK